MIKTLFKYGPFAFFVLTMFVAIVPARLRVRTQAIAAMILLAAFSKFFCYAYFGGDAFSPDMPEQMIWGWNGLYSAAVLFMALSCAWMLLLLILRLLAPGGRLCVGTRTRQVALAVLAAASLALSGIGIWNGIKPPVVREVELTFPNLPAELDGYRILHISDLHVSPAARRSRTAEVVRRANAAGADLIVFTGDIVDGFTTERRTDVEPLRRLTAPDGVWFSTGNHEFYFDWFGWSSLYERWGLKFLRNSCVFPRPKLALGGVDDPAVVKRVKGADYPSVMDAFAAATNGEFRILLCHQPKFFREFANAYGIDLHLAGHTHGGIAPVLDLYVARHNGGFVRGLYRERNSILSISRGAGQWAGFPIRFFNDPELPLYVLRRGKPVADIPSTKPQRMGRRVAFENCRTVARSLRLSAPKRGSAAPNCPALFTLVQRCHRYPSRQLQIPWTRRPRRVERGRCFPHLTRRPRRVHGFCNWLQLQPDGQGWTMVNNAGH